MEFCLLRRDPRKLEIIRTLCGDLNPGTAVWIVAMTLHRDVSWHYICTHIIKKSSITCVYGSVLHVSPFSVKRISITEHKISFSFYISFYTFSWRPSCAFSSVNTNTFS
jgi:hypothetical protein